MSNQESTTLLRVGIFMAIGLAVIGGMVVYFGRFGETMRGSYALRAEFADASGIYKGASVLLAGAKIGAVENNPVILPDMKGVSVNLRIYDDVEIPSKAEFLIGSSGLLGDKFIQIGLGPDAQNSPPIPPNTTVQGRTDSGLDALTNKAGAVMKELQETVANIKSITEKFDTGVFTGTAMGDLGATITHLKSISAKLDTQVLSGTTTGDLTATIANLRQTSASFAESAKKLDDVIRKVEGAVGTGDEALRSAKATADSARVAAEELRKTITEVRGIVEQTKQGRGTLGALLVDRAMAENLKALVSNLRAHGILFYKDRPAPADRSR